MTDTTENLIPDNGAAQSIFRVMANQCPRELPACLRQLAQQSDLDALQAALDSGVVQEIAEKASSSKPYQAIHSGIAAAIAPLAMLTQPDLRVTKLVSAWRIAAGIGSEAELSAQLCHANSVEAAKALLELGADPLLPAPAMPKDENWKPGITVLGYVLRSQLANKTAIPTALLSHLADQDRTPIVVQDQNGNQDNLYDWMLNSAANLEDEHMTGILGAQLRDGTPHSWSLSAGRALLRYVEAGNQFDNDVDRRLLEMQLIALSNFETPNDWLRVLSNAEWEMVVPTLLARTETATTISVTIAEKMAAAGVDLDQVCSPAEDGLAYTWLHAAIREGNVPLTRKLLELGADPTIGDPVYAQDGTRRVIGSRNAFETATAVQPDNSKGKAEIISVLAAWKAQSAIQQIVARQKPEPRAPSS